MDIRREFLNFFNKKGHEIVPSAPLVPDDATLLFTNAGMVPFKSIFTGEIPRPNPPIRTSCQTCIRAGGKHNDLDNVGYTARHHTFFEMLGNFSFGEYFKSEVIPYAWEFITEILELPRERLYVTVHEKDDEAFEIWAKFIDKSRIYRFGDKDNFWAMGETGPCGPCSEIFYDQGEEHFHTDEDYMGGDGDRFLEIWNLVFMQFERSIDGTLTPLPKPSIDTGMGLERITAIKEGVFSNYDTSLFMPLINEVATLCNVPYEYEKGASYRVISDHIRSVVFLLAQGVHFDKEGRGYVLRRILRRALRHGYLLGLKKPFMYKLVGVVVDLMGDYYTYLGEKSSIIKDEIKFEEERFLATIASGISLFNDELRKTDKIFSGEVAFKLYDTYGFPLDLTADMLREKNLSVDEAKFDELMSLQKQKAKSSWKGSGDKASVSGDFKELISKFGENSFVGYDTTKCESKILALLDENFKSVSSIKSGNLGWVMLDKTPFYAQSGGQCADSGKINQNDILDTQKFFGLNLSKISLKNELKVGEMVSCEVSDNRNEIARHHSATHLLHAALRQILGSHIMQTGSSVEIDRLRFDFSHTKALSFDEIKQVENLVNSVISSGAEVKSEIMPLNEAKKSGAMALFGEKYGEFVRVLDMANGFSKELCGGTHVKNLAQIGVFIITKESGVSAGVRRIEAICSKSALKFIANLREENAKICELLKTNSPQNAILKLQNEIKSLKNEIKNIANCEKISLLDINGIKIAVCEFDGDIKSKIDELKNKYDKIVVVLFKICDEKLQIAAGCKGVSVKANDIVKIATKITGGGGGGRDDFATAGGKNIAMIKQALSEVMKFIKENV